MKMKAPKDCSSFSIGGVPIEIDEKTGIANVPDQFAEVAQSHGFIEVAEKKAS